MGRKKAEFSVVIFALVILAVAGGCARGRSAGPAAAGTDEEMAASDASMVAEGKQEPTARGADAVAVPAAVICADVQNREPVGAADSFPEDVKKVWCWSKIRNGQGQSIKHIYYYEGSKEAAVELAVDSPLWRTYSSKIIPPGCTGQWNVDIVDASGNVLKSLSFTIGD